jgi:thioredoxin reductase (NADPH)
MCCSTEVKSVSVDGDLRSATLRDVQNGEEKTYPCDGIFVFMGQKPGTEIFHELLALDEQGYIVTDKLMATSVPGVFAAGDVRQKKYRQITTAMADGTIAALEAERFIRNCQA